MPRHWLTEAEIVRLTNYPAEIAESDIITFFTLTESDSNLLVGLRGDDNRLGFALQLCTLRFLGFVPTDLSRSAVGGNIVPLFGEFHDHNSLWSVRYINIKIDRIAHPHI